VYATANYSRALRKRVPLHMRYVSDVAPMRLEFVHACDKMPITIYERRFSLSTQLFVIAERNRFQFPLAPPVISPDDVKAAENDD
jgi:hypothetical protein